MMQNSCCCLVYLKKKRQLEGNQKMKLIFITCVTHSRFSAIFQSNSLQQGFCLFYNLKLLLFLMLYDLRKCRQLLSFQVE